ncbi:MAG TPA: single-stranded-DNA-specific exonuclease RecJ [Bacillota bacterium]|nr:single-stranded-DNA-specific exonuclease RecJ [Bacillota bacterium]
MDQKRRLKLKRLLISRKWNIKENRNTVFESGIRGELAVDQEQLSLETLTADSEYSEYHPLLRRIWRARGYSSAEIQEIIYPIEIAYPSAFLFTDMKEAVKLIRQALAKQSKILIFGDYDADGLTATALLSRWFKEKGLQTINLIPDRLRDGYGLTEDQVNLVKSHNPDLVITVDCGSSSLVEVKSLEDSGIKVIVTDHHTADSDEHTASAFINPQREGEDFPLKGLAGVGVAYYLVRALDYPQDPKPLYTTLAAIGTVADVMPLRGVNRRLVVDAICYCDYAPVGIKALTNICRKNKEEFSASFIQFTLAPRLNAAGRLGQADVALSLLLTDDVSEASVLADRLDSLNNDRRELEKKQIRQADEQVESESILDQDRILIAVDESFHPGILGILSARLADQYQMPAICLAVEEDIYRGSARTYGDTDIYAAIASCQDLLLTFGGHSGAAGLSLLKENLSAFSDRIRLYLSQQGDYEPAELSVDLELEGHDLTLDAAHSLQILEPFGEQNPQPLFFLRSAVISEIRTVGDGSHLRLSLLLPERGEVTAIAFRQGDASLLYRVGDVIDIVFNLVSNIWRGNESVNLHIEEMRLSTSTENNSGKQRTVINRSMIAYVFNRLSDFLDVGQDLTFDPLHLAHWLSSDYNRPISSGQLLTILQLFSEAGLGDLRSQRDSNKIFCFIPVDHRIDLKTTDLWRGLYEQGRIEDASQSSLN